MAMKIGTLNARGGDSKVLQIIDTFTKHKMDILAIQEIHDMKPANVKEIEEKTESHVFTSLGTSRGRGVMTIVRASRELSNAKLHARDNHGNSLIVSLEIDGSTYMIQNIYARNDCAGRTEQFQRMTHIVKYARNFINCGDFNSIPIYDLDCTGKSLKNFNAVRRDREVLRELHDLHGYVDSYRALHPNKTEYTFTGLGPYRARLDRIYVHDSIINRVVTAEIIPVAFSDHDMYRITLKTEKDLDRVRWGRGMWKYNATLLEDPELLKRIENIWEDWRQQKRLMRSQLEWWEIGKRFLKDQLIRMGRKVKSATEQEEKSLNDELKSLNTYRGADAATKIKTVKSKLESLERKRLEGAVTRSRIDWAQKGEKSTTFFFDLEKKNGSEKGIDCMKSNDGSLLKTKDEILHFAEEHFKNKFKKSPIDSQSCAKLVGSVTTRLTDTERDSMDGFFTIQELERAHLRMRKRTGRSPGNDGLTNEFYHATWEFIKADLLDTINEIVIQGVMPLSMTQGVITLIYKNKGDRNDIKNWRAISLLNVDFKYLASMIAARMAPSLGNLLNPDQTSTVKGRDISDELILIQNMYDYYNSGSKDNAMIQAWDVASAFDAVSHEYLFQLLKAMNYSRGLISTLKTIYDNMYSCIIMNGAKTKYFRLERSCRQGSPEAVQAFLLTIEPLGNLLRSNRNLHPIVIPNQPPKYVGIYVDDSSMYSTNAADHKTICEVTKEFEKGSGARFNEDKTEILLLGNWTNQQKSQLPKELIKSNVKILGVYFGPNAHKLNRDQMLSKMDATIQFWKNVRMSFQGKKLIISTKILSQIYHVARVTGIDKHTRYEIQKRITQFFWYPRTMCFVSMDTLRNDISHGGLALPNLDNLNKAILVERIPKMINNDKPWRGELIYRNGFSLRKLTSPTHQIVTFTQ